MRPAHVNEGISCRRNRTSQRQAPSGEQDVLAALRLQAADPPPLRVCCPNLWHGSPLLLPPPRVFS
jgi:hypothetical protein